MSLPIAKQGWPFILPCIGLSVICLSIGWIICGILLFLLSGFIIFFFRDPERDIVKDENVLLSPADGRIIKIDTISQVSSDGTPCTLISIFMSVFNCHINRIPFSGSVKTRTYNSGKFLPAFREKASILNEQNTIEIECGDFIVKVRQIAGLIARRIVCFVKEKDEVCQGGRFGLIRFGSRVDMWFPKKFAIQVHSGQKVYGGKTVIARIKSE
ncbi:MAG: phosphatidylserine decarboxylase family protein [bacterium]